MFSFGFFFFFVFKLRVRNSLESVAGCCSSHSLEEVMGVQEHLGLVEFETYRDSHLTHS